jgi:hypothetical protein
MYFKQGKRSRIDRMHCHRCGKCFEENESKSSPAGADYFLCNACSSTEGIRSVATEAVPLHSVSVDEVGVRTHTLLNHNFLYDSPRASAPSRLKRYLDASLDGDEALKKYHKEHGRE